MARDSDKRNFALREDGNESSVFSGGTPRQAALKAARRLEPASSEEAAERQEIRLREKGTHKVHIYEAWAWVEEAPPTTNPTGCLATSRRGTSRRRGSNTSTTSRRIRSGRVFSDSVRPRQ